jgi:hypothetical protein
MSRHFFPGLGVIFLLPSSSAQAQTPRIDHQPVACAAAEKFPKLEARFAPADTVAIARVVFQGQGSDWYSVAMKPEGAIFTGVLPKPKKSLKAFRYYIEVTDKTLGTNRTADYTTSVVDNSSACNGRIMAGALASASVTLQGSAGVVVLPAGFASSGVVVAGSAAGSSAGAAGAAGSAVGGGGGLGTGAIVGIVAGAGAVAAGVVVATGGSSDTSYTGSYSGQLVVTGSSPCIFTRPFSGTMEITLKQSGGTATGQGHSTWTQTETVTGGPNCGLPGPSGGNQTFTYDCEITGTESNLSCIHQRDPSATSTVTHGFSGALNGGVISGTVKHDLTHRESPPYSGSASVPITLR